MFKSLLVTDIDWQDTQFFKVVQAHILGEVGFYFVMRLFRFVIVLFQVSTLLGV